MSAMARWADLGPRVASGLAMAGLGALALWAGGWVFAALAAVLAGLMLWEAAQLFEDSDGALRAGGIGAAALGLAVAMPWLAALPLLIVAVLLAGTGVARARAVFALLALVALAGAFALVMLRTQAGAGWALWLILVVIISDVAGYFAGKALGGPRVWPALSPGKTWSGTVAGWMGAALAGAIFAGPLGAGWALMPLSVLVGVAGQMGDIGESAVKRLQGVKDSSTLIPGHGGVLDRFDAMLGAALMAGVLFALGQLPGAGT